MRRYLTKLFDRWEMHWAVKELFPLAGVDGSAARWHASLTARAAGRTAGIEAWAWLEIERGLVKRNEVYYARAPLVSLLAPEEAAAE